ncbi:hypothetical protein BpHYR1_050904 [Brachionus plicatilis]|uniref:Uncharacterized protein n=1 Tax=Brachionus plicatilis TaxID=10195 RepID=A0A3M7RK20_BRAPC|nr:hypothetical protein BpHYR1_050904 [Brachionus plicatilis]
MYLIPIKSNRLFEFTSYFINPIGLAKFLPIFTLTSYDFTFDLGSAKNERFFLIKKNSFSEFTFLSEASKSGRMQAIIFIVTETYDHLIINFLDTSEQIFAFDQNNLGLVTKNLLIV